MGVALAGGLKTSIDVVIATVANAPKPTTLEPNLRMPVRVMA
jgi:hypothetical protein